GTPALAGLDGDRAGLCYLSGDPLAGRHVPRLRPGAGIPDGGQRTAAAALRAGPGGRGPVRRHPTDPGPWRCRAACPERSAVPGDVVPERPEVSAVTSVRGAA